MKNISKPNYRHRLACLFIMGVATVQILNAQTNPVIDNIVKEETSNSQVKQLAHELFDQIGPRLVGTPLMKKANDWAVAKYTGWNISAKNEQWGEWKGWERGVSHIDMISPRIHTLEGTQLAWSPSTKSKGVTAGLVIIPDLKDSIAFEQWLPTVKGKFVMVSMMQPTGRPDDNWAEFGLKESIDNMKKDRQAQTTAWAARIKKQDTPPEHCHSL